ncbi:MAG TPA: DUF1631 family protein [Lysobacter sp.]|nr:DUF1631 family protein [Lysobacter sp.]
MSYPNSDPFAGQQQDGGLLLDALQKQLLERAMPALDRALGKVDDYLFDHSQSGKDELGLTALRDLRLVRGQVVQAFEQSLIAGFRKLRDPRSSVEDDTPVRLSLLSEDALEEQLANEQMADSLSRLHAPALELVGKRIAHLLHRDNLPPVENPLMPVFLAHALRDALERAELDAGIRIVVFKYFERELATALGHAYERCNSLLVSAGVLPQLKATAKSEAMPPQAPLPGEQATAPAPPQAQAGGGVQMQGAPVDQALFANLLGLLQGWRSTMPHGQPPVDGAGPAHILGSHELMSVLSLLQRDLPNQLAQWEDRPQNSLAEQLRSEVVQGARRLGVASDNLRLDGLDEDAVDLVALLFDVLLDGPQYDSNIRGKIGRMLVPYVKVAVKDRRMFLYKEHPARRLLNTVAEACEGNHGEAPQERELLGQVDTTIERLVAEFNEDVAIFETLEQELRAYMAQHRKRFELSEKRAAETQRGRERLDQARNAAAEDLGQRRGDRVLPAVMGEFLDRHAMHHLTQVVLRDGHGSPRHEQALQAVDALMQAFDASQVPGTGELPQLPRAGLEAILASSGCIDQAAHSAVDLLQDAVARMARGEHAADNDAHMPVQQLPEPPPAEPEPLLEVVAGTDRLDFDADTLSRMRNLAVGTWLQLATAPDRVEPAKVSWISPISSRLLLVNRRGVRVLVASVEELAAMVKLGKLSLREADTAFDDALHQVAGRLKSVAEAPAQA